MPKNVKIIFMFWSFLQVLHAVSNITYNYCILGIFGFCFVQAVQQDVLQYLSRH